MSNKAKKSFVKPAIGAIAALAVIGAFVPSEENSKVEDIAPPVVVEEVKEPTKSPVKDPIEEVQKEPSVQKPVVEIDTEQAFGEKTSQHNYVGSLESDKYHEPSCRWAKEIHNENLIHFDTEDEASSAGYLPCGSCKP